MREAVPDYIAAYDSVEELKASCSPDGAARPSLSGDPSKEVIYIALVNRALRQRGIIARHYARFLASKAGEELMAARERGEPVMVSPPLPPRRCAREEAFQKTVDFCNRTEGGRVLVAAYDRVVQEGDGKGRSRAKQKIMRSYRNSLSASASTDASGVTGGMDAAEPAQEPPQATGARKRSQEEAHARSLKGHLNTAKAHTRRGTTMMLWRRTTPSGCVNAGMTCAAATSGTVSGSRRGAGAQARAAVGWLQRVART